MNSGSSVRCRPGDLKAPNDAMDTALEMLQSQSEWLLENRTAIDAKIQQGIAELDRGEGIPEDELDAHFNKLKAEPE
jgi:predicted transcriptional regulator